MHATQNKNNDKNKAVLFIDDEKTVLEVGSLMLQKLGYNVLAASNGHKAIMPGMNGYEIYHQLKKIQPELKILLASGYPGDQAEKRLESIGFNGYLQKPFTLKQLSEKIDEIRGN